MNQTLGEYIKLEKHVSHIVKAIGEILDYNSQVNLRGNYYLQRYLWLNKDIEFKNLNEGEVNKIIINQAESDLLENDRLAKIEYNPNEDLVFLDDIWNIVPPTIEEGIKGLDTIQEIALILADLQDGKPEALADLCCAYVVRLRGGEKLTGELVKDIPLWVAFKVKKMLETSVELLCLVKAKY